MKFFLPYSKNYFSVTIEEVLPKGNKEKTKSQEIFLKQFEGIN